MAAFPLLGSKLPEYCDKLMSVPDFQYWIHEKKLAAYLSLPSGQKHGPADAMTALIACVKKGFGGNDRRNTKVATGHPSIDMAVSSSRIYYQDFRTREEFVGGKLNTGPRMRTPRYFRFGTKQIEVGAQLKIANELVGNMPVDETGALDSVGIPRECARRRANMFRKFYRGETNNCKEYPNEDVPLIAYRNIESFADIGFSLTGIKCSGGRVLRRSFKTEDLERVEDLFRAILMATNKCGKMVVSNNTVNVGYRDAVEAVSGLLTPTRTPV